MPTEVRVPVLGESVVEATVGAWLKHEGDHVEAGESLVQLETEKVNVDVAADQAGVLGAIARQEGETVHPGDVLARIEESAARPVADGSTADPRSSAPAAGTAGSTPASGTAGSAQATGTDGSPPASGTRGSESTGGTAGSGSAVGSTGGGTAGSGSAAGSTGGAGAPAPGADGSAADARGAGYRGSLPSATAGQGSSNGGRSPEPLASEPDRPHASPVARRMAEESGIDLGQVAGTGTAGRVTREDVERHLTQSGSQAAPSPSPVPPQATAPGLASSLLSASSRGETRIRMSRRRQTIAARLLEAQRTAAMLTTFNEADLSAIMAMRTRRREAFLKRHGVGLGFMSFFTKAVVAALIAFPDMNSEIRGDEIIRKHYYDIGIAVGAEGGLVVPIVRDADRMSFAELERKIAELAEKARTNTLTLDDLRGGTFTITNGGVYGSLLSTPILSPPQVGILGMHRILQRPIAVDNQVVIRPMMYLALTYDHRLIDGGQAVQFLIRIKELIEDPTGLMLDS